MFDYPCANCVIESICTKECPAFSSELNRLMKLGMEAQDRYSGYQGISRNTMKSMKTDLVLMLRTDIRAKKDPEFVKLVYAFNRIYTQACRLLINKHRKAGFKK